MSHAVRLINNMKPLFESEAPKNKSTLQILKEVLVGDKDQYGNAVVDVVKNRNRGGQSYLVKFDGPDGKFKLEYESESTTPEAIKDEAQEWLACCGGD